MIEPTIDLTATFAVRVEDGQVRLVLHAETNRKVSIAMDAKAARILGDKLLAAAWRLDAR